MTTIYDMKQKNQLNTFVKANGFVSDIIRESSNTKTLRIRTPNLDRPFRFKPRQFVIVRPFIK